MRLRVQPSDIRTKSSPVFLPNLPLDVKVAVDDGSAVGNRGSDETPLQISRDPHLCKTKATFKRAEIGAPAVRRGGADVTEVRIQGDVYTDGGGEAGEGWLGAVPDWLEVGILAAGHELVAGDGDGDGGDGHAEDEAAGEEGDEEAAGEEFVIGTGPVRVVAGVGISAWDGPGEDADWIVTVGEDEGAHPSMIVEIRYRGEIDELRDGAADVDEDQDSKKGSYDDV